MRDAWPLIIRTAILTIALLVLGEVVMEQLRARGQTQVFVIPFPVISVTPQVDPELRRSLGLALQRTEYLRTLMEATCKPDGFGARVRMPDPPPGWPRSNAQEGLTGAWGR